MSERTAVYRLYDAGGALLYVGAAVDPPARWKYHAANAPWWPEVQRQTIDWYPDRPAALAAEETAICAERPRHNITHTDRRRRGPADRLAALSAADAPDGMAGILRSFALAAHRSEAEHQASHDALVDGIWVAHDEGWPQVEIVKAVGLTRERIRQLCDPEYRRRAIERRAK